MPFVTKNAELQRQYKQKEAELNDRQEAIEAKDNALKQKEEDLLSNELALDELLKEAKRPEEEFKKLEQENQRLKNKLANENEKYKQQEAKRIGEIEILKKKNEEFRQNIRKHKEEIKSISEDLETSNSFRETYKFQIEQLSEKYELKIEQCDSLIKNLSKVRRENTDLTREKESNTILIQGLKTKNSNLESRLERLKSELGTMSEMPVKKASPGFKRLKISYYDVFSDLDVIHKLSEDVTELIQPPDCIITIGSGPFLEGDFDDYLKCLDITPVSGGSHWIIVGRDGWDEGKLIELIEDNDLDEVVVLSQELFVAGIISTHNPFSLPEDILMKFADGHPALEFLMRQGFEWPEILIEDLDHSPTHLRGPSGSYERVEMSPIYSMGYVVGITNGIPFKKRTKILEEALDDDIPWVGDDEYMEEWGKPRSRRRLWRTVHHLAWLIRSRKSNPTMSYAVRDWKNDLDWLGENYGDRALGFSWPNI